MLLFQMEPADNYYHHHTSHCPIHQLKFPDWVVILYGPLCDLVCVCVCVPSGLFANQVHRSLVLCAVCRSVLVHNRDHLDAHFASFNRKVNVYGVLSIVEWFQKPHKCLSVCLSCPFLHTAQFLKQIQYLHCIFIICLLERQKWPKNLVRVIEFLFFLFAFFSYIYKRNYFFIRLFLQIFFTIVPTLLHDKREAAKGKLDNI